MVNIKSITQKDSVKYAILFLLSLGIITTGFKWFGEALKEREDFIQRRTEEVDKILSSLTPEERVEFLRASDKNLEIATKIMFLTPKEKDVISRLSKLTFMSPTDVLLRIFSNSSIMMPFEDRDAFRINLTKEFNDKTSEDYAIIRNLGNKISQLSNQGVYSIYNRLYGNRYLDTLNELLKLKLQELTLIYDRFFPAPGVPKNFKEDKERRIEELRKAGINEQAVRRTFEERQRVKLANAKKDFGQLKALRAPNKPRHFA